MRFSIAVFLLFVVLTSLGFAQDTIQVSAGWNIIASFRDGAPLDVFHSVPPGIIITDLYRLLPEDGYQTADTLVTGGGYWLKVSADGLLVFHPSPLDSCGIYPITHGGKVYNTVRIGNQCWFKENLDIGEMIDSLQNATDNGVIEKYCYSDDVSNCLVYGGLYQWHEAMLYDSTIGTQGICPPEWHVATNDDYQMLLSTSHWSSNALLAVGQGAGTNSSGFTGMLSGRRTLDGVFSYLDVNTTFWKSNKGEFGDAGYIALSGNSGYSEGGRDRFYGFSVRCVHD